ncbi:MAG TPA: glycosyltransferase family 39 protein [Clostridia bacterium]
MEEISYSLTIIAVLAILFFWLQELGVLKLTGSNKIVKFLEVSNDSYSSFSKKNKDTAIEESAYISKEDLQVFKKILIAVIATRVIIYLIGMMAVILTKNQDVNLFKDFQGIWNKWDSPHYLSIAENGYLNTGDEANFIVFYPLYPLLVKIVSFVLQNYFLSGIIVSNTCLVIACCYLYKLVKMETECSNTAFESVKYLLIFPFAFFFGIVYTESTFLMLSVMTIYYIRRGEWLKVGLAGMLAALTKNQGILLLVPAAMEYIIGLDLINRIKYKRYGEIIGSILKNGLLLLLIPCGFGLYLLLNKIVTGNWYQFLKVQEEHWYNKFGYFPENLKNIANNAFNYNSYADRISLWLPQVIVFFVVAILIFLSLKRLKASYACYMLAYLVVTFSPTWLLSAPRYVAALFPIYIVLALISAKYKTVGGVLKFAMIMLLGFYTMGFACGAMIC